MYVGIDYTSVLYVNSGPPRPCFGRKDGHSGSYITGKPPLLLLCCILQNLGIGGLASRGDPAIGTIPKCKRH